MTTVAYKDGVMAADSQMNRGSEATIGAQKVFRTAKYLVGCSGDMSSVQPFVDWLTEAEKEHDTRHLYRAWDDLHQYDGGVSAILVARDGVIWTCHKAPPVMIPRAYEALGSGCDYAMAAMHMGASATEAVRVARTFDTNTGGPIHFVRFKDEVPVRLPVEAAARKRDHSGQRAVLLGMHAV